MSAVLDQPAAVLERPVVGRASKNREAAPSQHSPANATHRAISLVAALGLLSPLFVAWWGGAVAVPSIGLAIVALSAGVLILVGAIATAGSESELARLDRWLLALALLVLAAWAAVALLPFSYGTDEAAFEQAAANLLLHGHDPYGAHLGSTLAQFGTPAKYATYTMSGGTVSSYGYPALPLLVVAVFVELTGGGQAPQLADIAALMLATVLAFRLLPRDRRALAVIMCIGVPAVSGLAVAGVNSIIAMAALVVVADRWDRTGQSGALGRGGRLKAVALGVALATNQIAWLIAPFLLVGILCARRGDLGGRRALRVVAAYAGVAAATFVVIDAPFIAWGPSAWLHGVAAPLTQHAIPYGQGLVGLTLILRIGGGALDAYNYAAGLLYLALLVVYALRFRTLARALFLLPIAALFISGRSLGGYWMTMIPVIAVGAITVGGWGTGRAGRPAPDGRSRFSRLHGRAGMAALFAPAAFCLGVALAVPPPLTMRILGAQSDAALRSVDRLRVRVANRSDEPLRPHFATNVTGQAVLWRIVRGPALLPPRSSAVYVLTQPETGAMPPNGSPFILQAMTPAPRTISSTAAYTQPGVVPGSW